MVQTSPNPIPNPISKIRSNILPVHYSAELEGSRELKDPAGHSRFRAGFGSKAVANQAQKIRHGTYNPAHNDSESFWADFGVFRRRIETFKLCDSSAEVTYQAFGHEKKYTMKRFRWK